MAPCGLTEAVFRGHDLPLEPVLLLQEPPRCPQAPCRVPTGSQKAPQRKCLEHLFLLLIILSKITQHS